LRAAHQFRRYVLVDEPGELDREHYFEERDPKEIAAGEKPQKGEQKPPRRRNQRRHARTHCVLQHRKLKGGVKQHESADRPDAAARRRQRKRVTDDRRQEDR
jgi:hypothetical protein